MAVKKTFLSSIRMLSKSLVKMEVEQSSDKPDCLNVRVLLKIEDHSQKKEVSKGERLNFVVGALVDMYESTLEAPADSAEGKACFHAHAHIAICLEATKLISAKEEMPVFYKEEILSLVYDDLRVIVEDTINRTEYRGFFLPVDFREAFASRAVPE